jgi:hypothetical protein
LLEPVVPDVPELPAPVVVPPDVDDPVDDPLIDAPLANTPAVFSRVPMGVDGKPVVDSVASYDVTLDETGGFLACALRADEIVRVESVPESAVAWGETVRPRSGMIGWHVIRMHRKR